MATSKTARVRKILRNPMVQRLIIWAAPIVLRYVVKQLKRSRQSRAPGRKYVRNKAK